MNSVPPGKGFGKERSVIYLMTFIMGGCGIAYEYTFSKLSADLLGNSAHQWAITIGLMMFFMGIGSDLQKHFQDKHLFDKFILFELLLGIIGAVGPVLLLVVFGQFREHYVLVQYGLTTAVGFLIGLEIPILTRINADFAPELKVNIGGVLRMDYVGAFAGAVAWVLILPHFFTLTQISFVLGVFNIATAGLALIFFRRMAYRKMQLYGFTFIALLALSYGLVKAPVWTSHAEQWLYEDQIIYAETTRYQHIVVTESPSKDLTCFINGNVQFSSYDEHIYHEFLVHPAMLTGPVRKKVLILGGGDGLALREVLKYNDVEEVTLVDLDPGMTNLARTNQAFVDLNENSFQNAKVKVLENNALVEVEEPPVPVVAVDRTRVLENHLYEVAEVNLIHLDAVKFLEQISGMYDVIILDFPDPSNLELSKLYSLSFYKSLRTKLSRDGILVQQSCSATYNKEAFLCVGRTLQASGFTAEPYHQYVPSFGDWGWWIAARDDSFLARDFSDRLQGIQGIPVPVRVLTPELLKASQVFALNALENRSEEINTIVNNVIFRLYQEP